MTGETIQLPKFKIFDLYDISEIRVKDPGLRDVLNLDSKLILKSFVRNNQKYGQTKVNVVERIINRLAVAGHRGKKHRIILGHSTGKYSKNAKIILNALALIENKTKKNPVEVLIQAIENVAPRDEVTLIEYGGAKYPQAVDVAPLRRINLAIRWLVQGSSDKAFNKKKTIAQGLADEITMAADNNGDSFSVRKKNESEKQADSAR